MNTGHGPTQCAHCGNYDRSPDVQPYLVTDSKGEPRHVWLHPRPCKERWFIGHRSRRRQQRNQAA